MIGGVINASYGGTHSYYILKYVWHLIHGVGIDFEQLGL